MSDGLKVGEGGKTSCLKFHDLVPTGVPSFTSYYSPCYTLCYSSSKLPTLALCSGCAHSGIPWPGLFFLSYGPALPAPAGPSSHPSVHLLQAFSGLCLSQETAGFLRAGPSTCAGRTRPGPPECSTWCMATRTPGELTALREGEEDTVT